MISKEGPPALGGVRIARSSFHPTGDGSLGKIKTEHEEFPMNPRRSPGGALNEHTGDQLPNLLRYRSSSDLPPDPGNQPPVHTKTTSVPADHGFRRDQDEGLLPGRPASPSNQPKELIEQPKTRVRMSRFQRKELLTQSEILKKETLPHAKEAYQYSEAEPEEAKHTQDL
jgi:hypothetical protein